MAHQPTASARKSESKGAADDSPPSSTSASYDPTIFQRPHPDDRGGGNGNGKPRKKGDGADNSKAKTKSKDGTGKKGFLSLDRCGWCDTEGASRTCSQCRSVVYCSPACQKVSA